MKLTLPRPFGAQQKFLEADTRYVAYGGSRGGGKSFAVRMKAILLCMNYPRIRVLIIRRTYPEVYENHIKELTVQTASIAVYRDSDKSLTFKNGSRIKFGYCAADSDLTQYQGVEYDVIFMDEATQFTEYQFRFISASLRGANEFPKRFYLTCNPGGPGHGWVKRLFVDRVYKDGENAADYTFIRAGVRDNLPLLATDREYLGALENLPDDLRRAWLDGDWDVFAGQYFPEFSRERHTVEPFVIPSHWRRYRAFDYGLDMLAVLWAAVDDCGTVYVYRELCRSGLIISEAAKQILAYDGGDEIYATLAPPDLWNRSQETGKSKALLFAEYGVPLTRASNDRETGWLAVKELLAEGGRRVYFFRNCEEVIRCLPQLQVDPVHPTDTRNEPHEITHAPDALRYFAITYTAPAKEEKRPDPTLWPRDLYEDWLRADAAGRRYLEKRMERAGT